MDSHIGRMFCARGRFFGGCGSLFIKLSRPRFHSSDVRLVFFNGFNDWSLNIMVIAWYHPAVYRDDRFNPLVFKQALRLLSR